MAAFVDRFMLGDAGANTDVQVHPYPTLDYGRWTAWWGTAKPTFPNDRNPGDGTIVMHMNRPLDLNPGDEVSAGYALYMGGAHPEAAVSLEGGFAQTDVWCPDGTSYSLNVPLPNQSYPIPALDNS